MESWVLEAMKFWVLVYISQIEGVDKLGNMNNYIRTVSFGFMWIILESLTLELIIYIYI